MKCTCLDGVGGVGPSVTVRMAETKDDICMKRADEPCSCARLNARGAPCVPACRHAGQEKHPAACETAPALSACSACGAKRVWNVGTPQCVRCYGGRTLTPAEMLGEAQGLLRRAEALLRRTREAQDAPPHLLVMADEAASNAASWVEDLIVMGRMREAEAREAQDAPSDRSCYYSGRGMPEHDIGGGPVECLMCTAKRAEDRARGQE